MSIVEIRKCEEYDVNLIQSFITNYIKDNFQKVKFDPSVFIKLNLVGPFDKDKGITTHPNFLKAVIKEVKKYTKNIIVGDNPAVKDQIYTMKKTGIYDVVIEENVQILDQKQITTISYSNYSIYNKFEVTKQMVDCDILINLPKLKTHTLAYMTCAEKNFFGLIYGLNKSGWHVKASTPLDFSEAINDLYGALLETLEGKPILNICDGILGLEGEGPSSSGIPKKANAILMSNDAVSLDYIACKLVKLDEEKIYITNNAHNRGLGCADINNITLIGDSLDLFADISFLAPKDSLSHIGLRILKIKPIRNIVLEHPKIDHTKCIKCGECVKICPPKTMKIEKDKNGKVSFPHLKKTNCIRCWCCAEVCPQNAIYKSRRPILGKILF